jgi:hypothetical protein
VETAEKVNKNGESSRERNSKKELPVQGRHRQKETYRFFR